jgi:hypothetical protein
MKNLSALILSLLFVSVFGIISMACEEEEDIYRCEANNPYTPIVQHCFQFIEGITEQTAEDWCLNMTIGMPVVDPAVFKGKCDLSLLDPAGYCNCDMNDEDPEGGCKIKTATYDGYIKGQMFTEVAAELIDDPEQDCLVDVSFSAAAGCHNWGGEFVCTAN